MKIESHRDFWVALSRSDLPSGVAFAILQVCGMPKADYMARTHHPSVSAAALELFDANARSALRDLLGVFELTNPQIEHTNLRIADEIGRAHV